MLAELDLGRTEKCVRGNSVSSGLAEDDLQVILQAEVLPPALMLPKVEDTQEVQWVRAVLQKVLTFFPRVKVSILLCRNTLLQVKVLNSKCT